MTHGVWGRVADRCSYRGGRLHLAEYRKSNPTYKLCLSHLAVPTPEVCKLEELGACLRCSPPPCMCMLQLIIFVHTRGQLMYGNS